MREKQGEATVEVGKGGNCGPEGGEGWQLWTRGWGGMATVDQRVGSCGNCERESREKWKLWVRGKGGVAIVARG